MSPVLPSHRLPVVLGVVALVSFAAPARAEKADREKEIQVLANRLTADDAKREAVYEGNVIVTQGTMRITSARATSWSSTSCWSFPGPAAPSRSNSPRSRARPTPAPS